MVGLGIDILQAVFEFHPSKRDHILGLTHLRLVGTTAGAALPFVRLLACLVRNEYGLLSDHLDQLRVRLQCYTSKGCASTGVVLDERRLLARSVLCL